MVQDTDKVLMGRWIHQHDADAFAELVSRYAGMVYGTSRRILQDPVEAQDVAQECFFGVARVNEPVAPALAAWLHRLATNRSVDVLRRRKRREQRERHFAETIEPRSEVGWNDIEGHVDEAIATLPDKLRAPLVTHFLQGRSYSAIAEHLGMPRSTVASRVEAGIKQIRKSLKKRGIAVPLAALGGLLTNAAAEAAPEALLTTLGKVAVAGTAGLVTPKLLTIGGLVMTLKTKTGIAAALVVLALAGTLAYEAYRRTAQPPEPVPHARPAEQARLPEPGLQEDTGTVETTTVKPPEQAVEESSAPSEEPPLQPETPEVQPAYVSGWVVDEHLYGISGAKVQLHTFKDGDAHYLDRTYTTHSGPDGAFEISGIDVSGGARLAAHADGYVPGRYEWGWIKLAPGVVREDVQIKLRKGGFLVAGRVVDEARRGIPGAAVKLLNCGYDWEGLLASKYSSGTNTSYGHLVVTDELGHFAMAIAVEGLCDFSVAKDGYGPGVFPAIMTGTTDALFVLHSPGAIAGRVTRLNGRPADGARIDVVGETAAGGLDPETELVGSRFGLGLTITYTGPDGRYRVEGLGEECFYVVKANNPPVPETANKGDSEARRPDDWPDALIAREGPNVRRGVRVKAGQTTEVDLVLPGTAQIFGRVTDTRSRRPVYPFRVSVHNLDGSAGLRYYETRTDADGWYYLVAEVDQPTQFSVQWKYSGFTGGDVRDERQTQQFPPIQVGPGDDKRFDFSVDAPISVPVRCVFSSGGPRNDVLLWLRYPDEPGRRWSAAEVDANGQAVLLGLAPNEPFQAVAATRSSLVVGISEPFSGEPGETLPELLILCDPLPGGIEAVVTDNAGNPLADVRVTIRGVMADGTMSDVRRERTDENGLFTILEALPEGAYAQLLIGYEQADQAYIAVVESVTSIAGEVTSIGEVRPEPIPSERAGELFARDPERF